MNYENEIEVYLRKGWKVDVIRDRFKPPIEGGYSFTLISPRGFSYHGNHNALAHGQYTIKRKKHNDFSRDSFDSDSFSEIREAFNLASLCDKLGSEGLSNLSKGIEKTVRRIFS